MRRILGSALLLAASPAAAEVMDKEPTVDAIWQSVIVAVAITCITAVLQRWLLLLSFVMFLPSAAVVAWTECHTRSVGPAILAEAGPAYPRAANAAVALVVAVHVAAWYAVSSWRRRSRPGQTRAANEGIRAVAYSVALFVLMALASTSGFPAEPRIYGSVPFVIVVASVVLAAARWGVGRRARGLTVAAKGDDRTSARE